MRWIREGVILFVLLVALSFFVLSLPPVDLPPDEGSGGSGVTYSCYSIGTPYSTCQLGSQNCVWSYVSGTTQHIYSAEVDEDGDGYYTICGQDCDDGDRNIYPGATESCVNTIDDNCDGIADACPLKVETFSSSVSGTTVTLMATTNYVASCCFSEGASDYDTCDSSTNKIDTVTTDSSGVASVSMSQMAGTSTTYYVYCRSPP